MSDKHNIPVVVSGLGRCGTTLMMRMLEAGGMERGGDHYEEVEAIPSRRVVVKLLDVRLWEAPDAEVIWMQQDFVRQAKSQRWLLTAIGLASALSDRQLAAWLEARTREVLSRVDASRVMVVQLEELLASPVEVLRRISEWLGDGLNVEAMQKFAKPEMREMGLPADVIQRVSEKVRRAMAQ